jgi:hypothetical protein
MNGEQSWIDVWTSAARPIHLGNVAEFNEQHRAPARSGADTSAAAARRRARLCASHDYASLAPFYSPHPAVVLLPGSSRPHWLQLISDVLHWDPIEVYSDLCDEGEVTLSAAVAKRPALLKRLATKFRSAQLIGWGHTAPYHALLNSTGLSAAAGWMVGASSAALLNAVKLFDSKSGGNAMLAQAAAGDAAIYVPQQRSFPSCEGALAFAAAQVRRGSTVVLKTPYGVGGAGVTMLSPATFAATGVKPLVKHCSARLAQEGETSVLIEEYIPAAGPFRDLTVDALIAQDGSVHPVGVGVMNIQGTSYVGVTVGPSCVPERYAEPAIRLASAVGRRLADAGYRGWFDIDLVTAQDGKLCPTEINCRLTGPAVAFCIAARLSQTRTQTHYVCTFDKMPLGARIPDETLYDHVQMLQHACSALGVSVIPTLVDLAYAPEPSLGLALAATDRHAIQLASRVVHAANLELERLAVSDDDTAIPSYPQAHLR